MTKLIFLRKSVQVLAILFLIAVPILNYLGIHLFIGNFSSSRIMGFSMTMPLEALETIFASQKMYIPILITTIVPVLFTFLFGAFFCSWICPQNSFSEVGDLVHRKFHKRKLLSSKTRYFFIIPFLLIPFIFIIDAIFGITLFSVFHPPAIFARTSLSIVFFGTICIEIILIILILLVEIFGIRRAWCRYVCPLGAFLSIIGFLRIWKVKFNKVSCNDCLSCLSDCPFGNDPRKEPIRCRNCGTCVSKCKKGALNFSAVIMLFLVLSSTYTFAEEENVKKIVKESIRAIYIPMADAYAGIVAFEKYRDKMIYADYSIERMASLAELRAYFISGEIDVAYVMVPLAMDMFLENPNFKCVSLMQRDGSALAINDLLNTYVNLPAKRKDRKPDYKVAGAYAKVKEDLGKPSMCAVSSLLATHSVILYKYLKDHGKSLALGRGDNEDVVAVSVSPINSPSFIKKNNSRGIPASFVQSLPWGDVVETQKIGHVALYSKDVIVWPSGHVQCIVIATDECIKNKKEALREVISYLHKGGMDIETSRNKGGKDLISISDIIRLHIPEHNEEAIIQTLNPDLNVINYKNLNIDKKGIQLIMDLAVEAKILKKTIDIDNFTDESFSITDKKHTW
ncbi:MAG: 4Fe-4S binding protein [Desulfobacterales bacterium]|nr:4Fe-4S binding protein [Desulfobacterales bacterium]